MNRYIINVLAAVLLFAFAGIDRAVAVPAYPHPVTVTLSDGTQITIRISGDEFHHQILSEDGYALVGGPDKDYYYAALGKDGRLVSTGVKARPVRMLSTAERTVVSGLQKGIRSMAPTTLQMPRVDHASPMARVAKASKTGLEAPDRISISATKGELRSLVILAGFKDVKFTVSSTKQSFDNLLNQPGYSGNGATGSAWDYYHANSNGQFDPDFVVVGPYNVSRDASYYAGSDGTENVDQFVKEVCELADVDVNFAEFADNGVVRDIFIFYAGHNQAEGAAWTIWPHRSGIKALPLDGVNVSGYACTSEYSGGSGANMAGIGTFSHEFGHVLGWPDFYDTDYEGSGGRASALEHYSMMCSGAYNNNGRTPPALNILERWMMGWVVPQEFTDSRDYELTSIVDDCGYIIPTGTENEYFMVEYRGSKKNVWDDPKYINNDYPGMIVYHVDYSAPYQKWWDNYNSLNANPSHECMKLVRSKPNASTSGGQYVHPGLTFFPGKEEVTQLLPTSNIHYKTWDGGTPPILFNSIIVDNNLLKLNITRIGGPDIRFTADAYQFDALLNWQASSSESWEVSWKVQNTDVVIGSTTLQTSNLHLSNLMPATTYEVIISGVASNGEEWEQTHVFSTQLRAGNSPHILVAEEYTVAEPVLLTLLDYRGNIKELHWYVDGNKVESNYAKLSAGEHEIKAVIVNNASAKEYLIKYITVK